MRFVRCDDPHRFASYVRPFLEARLERNILATVLLAVADGRFTDPPPMLVYATDEEGQRVAAVAMRTPPMPLLASGLDAAAAERLVEVWLEHDPDVPGVTGVADTARHVAEAWRRRTGGAWRSRMSLALHALQTVEDPPRPAPGRLVAAGETDRAMLVDWWRAFAAEADLFNAGADADAAVDHRIGQGNLWIWRQPAGVAVSMVGTNPPVAGVVRVGPVYTPPAHRRRGFAGTAVAEVSRRALAGGAHTCMLSTDLANPTSNRIYAEVGYRRFADWSELEFIPPAT